MKTIMEKSGASSEDSETGNEKNEKNEVEDLDESRTQSPKNNGNNQIFLNFAQSVSKAFSEDNNMTSEQSIENTAKSSKKETKEVDAQQINSPKNEPTQLNPKDNSYELLMKKKNLVKDENSKKQLSQPNNTFIAREMEFEKVCNFRKYFPQYNINQIIKRLPKLLTLEKDVYKKYLKHKYKNFFLYSFTVNAILEKFLGEAKSRRKSLKSHGKSTILDKRRNIFEQSDAFLDKLKSVAPDEYKFYAKKKSFFGRNQPSKNEIHTFVDLIHTLVQKNRESKADIKFSGKSLKNIKERKNLSTAIE